MSRRKGRKTYIRSPYCELANTTISYNVRDQREERILQFADSLPNYGGTVKSLLDIMQRLNIREPEEIYEMLVTRTPHVPVSIVSHHPLAIQEKPSEADFDPIAALF